MTPPITLSSASYLTTNGAIELFISIGKLSRKLCVSSFSFFFHINALSSASTNNSIETAQRNKICWLNFLIVHADAVARFLSTAAFLVARRSFSRGAALATEEEKDLSNN